MTIQMLADRRWRPQGNIAQGSAVLELMIGLAVGLLVLATLFQLVIQFQKAAQSVTVLVEVEENQTLAPLLLNHWVAAAGNNRWGQSWAETALILGPDSLDIISDISGPSGFPDNSIEAAYERISIRVAGGGLQLRSGDGSYQPFLRLIHDLQLARLSDILAQIRLTSFPVRQQLSGPLPPETSELLLHLVNYQANLFLEAEG